MVYLPVCSPGSIVSIAAVAAGVSAGRGPQPGLRCAGHLGGQGRQGPSARAPLVAPLPPLGFRCLNMQREAGSVARLAGWVPCLPVEALGGLAYPHPYPHPYPRPPPRRSPPPPSFRHMVYLPVHSAWSI